MTFLFYLISFIAFFSAIIVISATNPVHSVLALIFVFCNVCALLIMLNLEFIAFLFLIVYVGAIAILFLFIVMMLDIKQIEYSENILRYLPIGFCVGIIFVSQIFIILSYDLVSLYDNLMYTDTINIFYTNIIHRSNLYIIGEVMHTHYASLFLISGMVLLVAMIGAIILTNTKKKMHKKQFILTYYS